MRMAGPKAIGGAEKPPNTVIPELMQQVRFGVVLLGEGQSVISDSAGVAHAISLQRNRTRTQARDTEFVPQKSKAPDRSGPATDIRNFAPAS